ncbi:MAG: hypothetical protein COA79_21515 [Planctomycetota bacterium]|nr:MAG: hypothetical protein COA79_21515 [Planctomycetota bacterium]
MSTNPCLQAHKPFVPAVYSSSFQGKGVGRPLIEQTIHQLSDVTVSSTDLAVPFYKKMGLGDF